MSKWFKTKSFNHFVFNYFDFVAGDAPPPGLDTMTEWYLIPPTPRWSFHLHNMTDWYYLMRPWITVMESANGTINTKSSGWKEAKKTWKFITVEIYLFIFLILELYF
jgi:hypothetical protein